MRRWAHGGRRGGMTSSLTSHALCGLMSPCGSSKAWARPHARTYIESTLGMSKRHVNEILNNKNRMKWLDHVPQAVTPSTVRKEKDRYLRELIHHGLPDLTKRSVVGVRKRLPTDSMEKKLTKSLLAVHSGVTEAPERDVKEDITEALHMYRMLRPDAPPFYEEDAMLHLDRNLNLSAGGDEKTREKNKDNYISYQGHVPVVNPDAFLLALQSITNSLADDLQDFMKIFLAVTPECFPDKDDAFRFAKLMDILFDDVFPGLQKIEDEKDRKANIRGWMDAHWSSVSDLLPPEIRQIDEGVIAQWLHGHIGRVIHNQNEDGKRIWQGLTDDKTYRFSEDFAFDQYPLTPQYVDQRNMDFPLEDAGKYFERMMKWSGQFEEDTSGASNAFQEFVWDLEKIGLRNWLKMDVSELTSKLPNWRTGGLGTETRTLKTERETQRVAKIMLECAARGKSNLLDFEAVDPQKLMHEFPHREIEEELAMLPPNAFVSDQELHECVDNLVNVANGEQSFQDEDNNPSKLKMETIVNEEMNQYRKYGPVEWDEEHQKFSWNRPAGTNWDAKRRSYIPEQAVDPMLQLAQGNMRQVMLTWDRMGSMTKDGRVYYFRAMIAVGNGRGTFGFGVGFGNTMKEAKADGALKALQKLEHLDYDDLRMLCTPCKGEEYSQRVEIIPRPIGRGVVCNKKFLPLVYLLGLDNVKIRFYGTKWFSRIKALKRALDQIISRRTLANMTGQKYAALVAPGDHWVHWPDRWFEEVRQGYDAQYRKSKLERKHALKYKKRSNIMAVVSELKCGGTKHFYRTPLERHFRKLHKAAEKLP
eukprot:GEMP01022017.1.p1 GENE.GEMP01022017.1~~GEMP01022017.1.p1  ORF type:complete len:822 (+),score=191.83 GEMP01022017.1:25-2466(+)